MTLASLTFISQGLCKIPQHLPVILILRHAERYPIIEGEVGDNVSLTSRGKKEARLLAALLKDRLVHVSSSPVLRCLETAQLLLEHAHRVTEVQQSSFFGSPGAFIQNEDSAWQAFLKMGTRTITERLANKENIIGFRSSNLGAKVLLEYCLSCLNQGSGVSAFVTHDYILCLLVCSLLNCSFSQNLWPNYLEGAFIWREGEGFNLIYKEINESCLRMPQDTDKYP